MNKPILTSALILLLSSMAFSQTKKVSKDFNKDGVKDQAIITNNGGSSMSTTDVKFIDGKSKKKYEFSGLYSFGSFF